MEEHTSKFKARLGIFVLTGLLLFVIAIFYIGRQKHLFNPVFRVSGLFKNISGLAIGNNVRFSGINVGTVENIKIVNDTTVVVDVIIDKDVQRFIKTDCFMTIGSEGLIGDKIINVTQGSSEAEIVKEGQYLKSTEPVETDAIMSSLKITAGNAEIVSDQLAQILNKVNSGEGTFGMLINDKGMAENITATIKNLKNSTKGLDENMEAAKHNILLRGYFKNKKKGKEQDTEKDNSSDSLNKEKQKGKPRDGLINKLFKKNN